MVRNRVKELRKERRLRQEELAGRINISQQTVSRIENGDNALAADILMSLANYFDVSIDYILYRSDSRRGEESRVEFDEIQERNYNLCRRYEQLNRKNQELIFNLTEELESGQRLRERFLNMKREKREYKVRFLEMGICQNRITDNDSARYREEHGRTLFFCAFLRIIV